MNEEEKGKKEKNEEKNSRESLFSQRPKRTSIFISNWLQSGPNNKFKLRHRAVITVRAASQTVGRIRTKKAGAKERNFGPETKGYVSSRIIY